MSPRILLGAAAGLALVGGGAFVWRAHHAPAPVTKATAPAPLEPLPQSKPALLALAAREEASPKPEARRRAGRARMTLAYASAKRGDWKAARTSFERAATTMRAETGMSPAWGTASDQATYQALVCLQHEKAPTPEGREAAKAAYRKFITERPESPLVHAAHRRLAMLAGGTADPDDDALLQTAVSKQEARIRFETSVCGPKALSEMLRRTGREDPGYKALARLCGTTDAGTTVAGMRAGMRALGIAATGAELNRLDLARAPLPLILLEQDHYVLVVARTDGEMTVWDPRFGSEGKRPLPPLDDRAFRALVLTTDLPPGDYLGGEPPKEKPAPPTRVERPKARVRDLPTNSKTPVKTTSKTETDR